MSYVRHGIKENKTKQDKKKKLFNLSPLYIPNIWKPYFMASHNYGNGLYIGFPDNVDQPISACSHNTNSSLAK